MGPGQGGEVGGRGDLLAQFHCFVAGVDQEAEQALFALEVTRDKEFFEFLVGNLDLGTYFDALVGVDDLFAKFPGEFVLEGQHRVQTLGTGRVGQQFLVYERLQIVAARGIAALCGF